MNIKQKLTTGVATGVALATLFTTTTFAATIKVVGNGDKSDNKVKVSDYNTTVKSQLNNTFILNGVYSSANTGDNTANKNTGKKGDVSINTKGADSTVKITNKGSDNTLTSDCGCPQTDNSKYVIAGNGDKSDNDIIVNKSNTNVTEQTNNTAIVNFVGSTANSGGNTANKNTGGDVSISSGHAESNVTITNGGASNSM